MGCSRYGRWSWLVLMCLMVGPGIGHGATKSATIAFSAEILRSCSAGSTSDDSLGQFGTLDFGSHLSLSNNLTVVGTAGNGALRINCQVNTPYRVLLSAGGSGNVTARSMAGPGSGRIAYNLYTAADYRTVWDDSIGVAGVGNGSDQYLPVYGQVPKQTLPGPGVYSDTIMVTVSW